MMKSLSCVIKIFTSGFLLLASSCGTIANQVSPTAKQCSEKPNLSLDGENVKAIVLGDQLLTETLTVKDNQAIGRTFDGKGGQKLERSKNPDVCIWVFTPENQILTGDVLPKDGKYTMQISARQGSVPFNLALGLDVAAAPPPAASPSSLPVAASIPSERNSEKPPTTTTQTTSYNFPMAACGDNLPDNPNSYPIDMYPVRLPPSDANLRLARTNFCRDAYPLTTEDTGMKEIQVASFTSKQRAIEFMNILNTQFKGAKVGTPTKISSKTSQAPVENQQVAVTNERVEFGTGRTDTVISGGINSAQQKRYLLWCSGGQSMVIQVQQGNVEIALVSPDGQTIGTTNNDRQQWRGRLPSSGDYVVAVSAAGDSRYTIRVEVI